MGSALKYYMSICQETKEARNIVNLGVFAHVNTHFFQRGERASACDNTPPNCQSEHVYSANRSHPLVHSDHTEVEQDNVGCRRDVAALDKTGVGEVPLDRLQRSCTSVSIESKYK